MNVLGLSQLTVCFHGHSAWPFQPRSSKIHVARGAHSVGGSVFQQMFVVSSFLVSPVPALPP